MSPRPRTARSAPTGDNTPEFSVSEITGAVKRTLENAFDRVRVRGEIDGRFRGPHSSGHAYFSLREDRASIDAVVWKGTWRGLKIHPEAGMEVVATGKLSTFNSKYQLIVETIEPAGAGALMAMLERRKAALAAEGLFAESRKKRLPFMPRTIGIVTSPTGAVIRDIVHRVADRFPVHLVVWPVRVQGDTCGVEVAAGIRGLNALAVDGADGKFPRPDLVIVARGGGSIEDLWGFNDEEVVRAAAASDVPLISAVGHETDWTLIDLVADYRAPTPTGAAERAVPVRVELEAAVAGLGSRLSASATRGLDRRRERVVALVRALPGADAVLAPPRQRLDDLAARLDRALVSATVRARTRHDAVSSRVRPATMRRMIREKGGVLDQMASRLSPVALQRRVRERGDDVTFLGRQLRRAVRDALSAHAGTLRLAERALDPRPLERRVAALASRFDAVGGRNAAAFVRVTEERTACLASLDRLHETLGYKSVLARGFAVVRGPGGHPVESLDPIAFGDLLTIEMRDGTIEARAGKRADGVEPARRRKAKRAKEGEATEQATLF